MKCFKCECISSVQWSSPAWTPNWTSSPCVWGTGWRTSWWLCTSAMRRTTCWPRSRSSGWGIHVLHICVEQVVRVLGETFGFLRHFVFNLLFFSTIPTATWCSIASETSGFVMWDWLMDFIGLFTGFHRAFSAKALMFVPGSDHISTEFKFTLPPR